MGDFIDPFYHGIHLVFLLLVDEYLSAADVAAVVVGKWEMINHLTTPLGGKKYCSFLLFFPTFQFFLQIWKLAKDVVARHSSKVYGKAAIGAPPMSVTWLHAPGNPNGVTCFGWKRQWFCGG